MGRRSRLRDAGARRLAAARRSPVRRPPRRGGRLRRGRSRAGARRPGRQRPRALGARLLRQQPPPRARAARGDPRTSAHVHRRRRGARRRAGGDLRRSRQLAQRRREPARGRARLPAARRLRRRAGGEADDRELRDGGLAPRRLPGQPRLLPRALGVDVRARALAQLRSLAPALDRDRSRRGAEAVRRQGDPCPCQGRGDVLRAAQPLRLLRPRLDPRGGSLGHGLVALPRPGSRRRRLPPLRRHPVRGWLRRRALGRARGPGLGGSPERIEAGLEIAHRNLRPLVVG